MPCYTVSRATVQFGKNTDLELLREAFRTLGISVQVSGNLLTGYGLSFDRTSGILNYRESAFDLSSLKRNYSEKVVEKTAAKNGWKVSWTVNESGNREASVLRGSL
jgi:energy-converting hydrogenase Eha subunit G